MADWLNEIKDIGIKASSNDEHNVGRRNAERNRDQFKLIRRNRVHVGGMDAKAKKRYERIGIPTFQLNRR